MRIAVVNNTANLCALSNRGQSHVTHGYRRCLNEQACISISRLRRDFRSARFRGLSNLSNMTTFKATRTA